MTDCTCPNCRARNLWERAVEMEGGSAPDAFFLTMHLIAMAGNDLGIPRADLHKVLDLALDTWLSSSTGELGPAPKVH